LGARGLRATALATAGFFAAGFFFSTTAGATSATNGIGVVAAGSGILYGADSTVGSCFGAVTKKFLIADKNDIKFPFGYVKHIYSNCQNKCKKC
jgi:hypothetical protein